MFIRKIVQQLSSCCLLKHNFHWCVSYCTSSSPLTKQGLALEYHEDIAVISMNNGKDNRMSAQFLKDFQHLLDSIEGNSTCKALVTTGSGRFYSNGLDQEWMAKISGQELLDLMALFQHIMYKLLLFPLPTLAVINGHAFGGGAVLAFAHDLRTMNSEKGWLCLNEVLLYKRFSHFLTEFLRIKLGEGKNVSDALILGRRYTADEAYRNNLVNAANPNLTLLEYSFQVLQGFTGKDGFSREGLMNMKKDIYRVPIEAYEKEKTIKKHYFPVQFMNDTQNLSL